MIKSGSVAAARSKPAGAGAEGPAVVPQPGGDAAGDAGAAGAAASGHPLHPRREEVDDAEETDRVDDPAETDRGDGQGRRHRLVVVDDPEEADGAAVADPAVDDVRLLTPSANNGGFPVPVTRPHTSDHYELKSSDSRNGM